MLLKNIHIENSYRIWCPRSMKNLIIAYCVDKYTMSWANKVLNRSYLSMYFEWWYHNIAYYLTKPLSRFYAIKIINDRAKDVDLEEWR